MTIDYGYTTKATSDYTCIHVIGIENSEQFKDTLWSLDLWMDRVPLTQVLALTWRLAIKWKVHCIAPEAVTVQVALADQIAGSLDVIERAQGWVPRVFPITYKRSIDKGHRISGALEWRFSQCRVKLPLGWRREKAYGELWHQVEDFTPDLQNLRNDDAIDTLALVQEVVRPRGRVDKGGLGDRPLDPVERLINGELFDEYGLPLMSRIPLDRVPVREMLAHQMPDANPSEGKIIWRPA
jgi:hypothetical protein